VHGVPWPKVLAFDKVLTNCENIKRCAYLVEKHF
jgi:hypothetical protein